MYVWYSDLSQLVNYMHPWFAMGDSFNSSNFSGIFASKGTNGGVSENVSFRIVLTIT